MTAHKHAAILAQAAEEAKTDAKFYRKCECRAHNWDASEWDDCDEHHPPGLYQDWDYRRKPAKPRECWAGWSQEDADAGYDPWGSAWPFELKPTQSASVPLHMIEVTPEVRAALAAAGIEVSQ